MNTHKQGLLSCCAKQVGTGFWGLVLWLVLPVFAWAQAVKHLEPANWWVGMKYHQVQLLINGEHLGALEPRVNYPGVRIIDVTRVKSPNYLFVTLDIAPNAKPGQVAIELLAAEEVKTLANFSLKARAKDSAERQGFANKDAIYLLVPDRFANGDNRNDTVAQLTEKANRSFNGGRHGGDLKGMEQHLDYIKSMGFTQIWPTPLLENNQPEYSYHGYAATNNYQIDARFGSNEDYRHFVAAAKKKGIGVIQDIVLNHIGSKHWWMSDLPADDWLNFQSDFLQNHYVQTTHRRTTVQDPYAALADKAQFSGGWFVQTMPDLNQRNPLLARYLIQNSLWWIEYAGLSGIREDTYSYADKDFLSQWAKTILDEYPNFTMVGEEWTSNPALIAHWLKGKVNPDGHVGYMPSMMDFPIQDALPKALTEDEGWDTGVMRLYETLANDFQYPDPFHLVVFAENHDTPRIFSVLNQDPDLYRMAMAYLCTMRGIPQFFYGSEILLTSPKQRDDGAVRADMPGGWSGDSINAFNRRGLTAQQADAQRYLKRLLNWRKHNTAVQTGKLMHFVPRDGVYVYFRYDNHSTVMVALNKNKHETALDLQRFSALLAGKKSAQNVMLGTNVNLLDKLNLPARSATIIELQ